MIVRPGPYATARIDRLLPVSICKLLSLFSTPLNIPIPPTVHAPLASTSRHSTLPAHSTLPVAATKEAHVILLVAVIPPDTLISPVSIVPKTVFALKVLTCVKVFG